MATNYAATCRRLNGISEGMAIRQANNYRVDPDFDNDANDDELTGVGLDHLHQGNGIENRLSLNI